MILSTFVILTYMAALRLTAVADVMIIQATVPFVVAGLAWLAMRERASRPTLVASALATIGVAVMLGGVSLFIGHDPRQIDAAARVGAAVVELHTGAYCDFDTEGRLAERDAELAGLAEGARLPVEALG